MFLLFLFLPLAKSPHARNHPLPHTKKNILKLSRSHAEATRSSRQGGKWWERTVRQLDAHSTKVSLTVRLTEPAGRFSVFSFFFSQPNWSTLSTAARLTLCWECPLVSRRLVTHTSYSRTLEAKGHNKLRLRSFTRSFSCCNYMSVNSISISAKPWEPIGKLNEHLCVSVSVYVCVNTFTASCVLVTVSHMQVLWCNCKCKV